MRIVHVDDEPDMRLVVRSLLGRRHDVDSFEGVDDAITNADWPHTDVAIIDVMMPGRSGDVLLAWLADNHPHVKRVLCTALGDNLDLDRFALAHDIVSKPFTTEDLEKALG